MARIFTDEELAEFCLSPIERLRRTLDGEPVVAQALATEMAQAKRRLSVGLLDWLVLTEQYVLETYGRPALVGASCPERMAELALRSGFTLDDLVEVPPLTAGPGSRLEADVLQAIDAGDRDGALAAWGRCERLFQAVQDLRRDLISELLSRIEEDHGAEGVQAALLYVAERAWWKQTLPVEAATPAAERLRQRLKIFTVSSSFELHVEEHDDRWTVRMLVCATCGTQLRDRYGKPGWALRTVEGPRPMTYGQPALTVYQSHLPVIHHMFAIGLIGAPWPVFRCNGLDALSRPCEMIIYKDLADTAAEDFEVVGMVKPPA